MSAPANSTSGTGAGRWPKGRSGNPAGRRQGTPNRASGEVRQLAARHGPEAIEALVAIMRTAESEAARVAAARELLDRAYGKAQASVAVDTPEGITVRIVDTWARD